MQFDLLRAFPYPVLRPQVDDYVDGDIQATMQFTQSIDSVEIKVDIQFTVSVPEIVSLIAGGRARYVVVFACRDTYYRKSTSSDVPTFSHSFNGSLLRGELLVYPYIIATTDINDYSCPWINAEFGPGPFRFAEGSVLALDEPQAIFLDRESFRPISSAFVLVANENLADQEWRVDPSDHKVRIIVSETMKSRLDAARNDTKTRAILINSIYFSAVTQCIIYLKQAEDEYQDRRWAGIFLQKIADLGLSIEQLEETQLAQHLMKFPFALLDTYCLGRYTEV